MTTVKLFDRNGLEIDHLTRWDYNVKLQIYDFLSECDCESICIINNGNSDGKLVAQIEGNIPNEDFTIQLTLVDN